MRVVLFFEYNRKKDYLFRVMIGPVIVMLGLFFMCTLMDVLVPEWNETYMRLSNVMVDVLYLKTWNPHLWFNVWQLLSLAFPFYFLYVFMTGMGDALSEEERNMTMVYFMNSGVTPYQMFVGKVIFWMGGAVVACIAMMMENLLFSLLLHTIQGAINVVWYYWILLIATIFYMTIVLFLVAERGKRGVSLEYILTILIVPLVCSWVPAFLRAFSVLLRSSSVSEAKTDALMLWGRRLEVLTLFSPLKWCWLGKNVDAVYVICAILLIFVLMAAAVSIYVQRKWCDN